MKFSKISLFFVTLQLCANCGFLINSIASLKFDTPKISKFGIAAALMAISLGNKTFALVTFWLKKSKIEKSEFVLFTRPSSPNSPKTNKFSSSGSFCKAIKSAIERSKMLPFLGRSDGDKFMMIFCAGNEKFRFKSADFTRFSLSFIVAPASPAIENPGNPRIKFASTFTIVSSSKYEAHFSDFIDFF